MEKIDKIIERRIEVAKLYNSLLENTNGLQIPFVANGNKHIYQSYVVLLDKQMNGDVLIERLKKKGDKTIYWHLCPSCSVFLSKELWL